MARYFIRTAWEQMWRYLAQTILVLLGVGMGIANIILLMSMTDMGRRQTLGLLEQFGARVLIITPYVDLSAGPTALFSQANSSGHLPMSVYQALQESPNVSADPDTGIKQVSAMLPLTAHVSGPLANRFTTVAGATAQVQKFGGFKLSSGRWITLSEEQQQAHVAVLGYALAQDLFGSLNDLTSGNKTVRIRGDDFAVIGTLEHRPATGMEEDDSRVFIPLSTAQKLFGFNGVQGILTRYRQDLGEDEATKLVKADIARALPAGEDIDDTVSVFTIHEATHLMDNTLGIFRTVLLGVASIALIVAGIGIMNVMLIRVLRRRMEIGLRRAVGATTRSIVGQFIVESAVQSLLGAALGLLLGAGLLAVFAYIAHWGFYIGPRTLGIAVSFGALVGVAFGAYPAWMAGRVDPIRSLRYEQ